MKKHLVLLLCLPLALAACVNQPPLREASPQQSTNTNTTTSNTASLFPIKVDHVQELLNFCDQYSNLTPEAQKKTFAATTQALSENKNDLVQRIKLAAIYTLPTSRLKDSAKAQNILQDLLQGNSLSERDTTLVSLLYEFALFDNKRTQKDKEETRRQDALQQKYETLQQKHEALTQKYEALEQKLKDLKNIEKTMNERGSKTEPK